GDTGPAPALAELGRDADLFIVEATDRDGETERPTRNLLASTEAGHWARRAGARRLMLTHFWPGTTEPPPWPLRGSSSAVRCWRPRKDSPSRSGETDQSYGPRELSVVSTSSGCPRPIAGNDLAPLGKRSSQPLRCARPHLLVNTPPGAVHEMAGPKLTGSR